MNLMTASNQWASRPADERFSSLSDLHNFCTRIERGTKVVDIDAEHFRTDVQDREIVAIGRHNVPSKFSHTGFSHLASAVDFSATELRKLSDTPTLVSNILNNRLKSNPPKDWKIVLYQNGDVRARAFVSEKYGFIQNSGIVQRLMESKRTGWMVPPARPALANQPGTRPATAEDIIPGQGDFGLSVSIGDLIAPAGLYASWDDMFVFMVNPNRRLNSGLMRGVFVWNNLTKSRRFEITTFYLNRVCGNHICWDVSGVKKNRVIHIGEKADAKALQNVQSLMLAADNASTSEDEARIVRAKQKQIASTVEGVIQFVYSEKGWTSRTVAENALAAAEQFQEDHEYSDPKSVWGFVNGLTRISQASKFTDERAALDLAAGKILETVF